MLKRIRISTLMLLVVIAALIVGLVVEKRRSALLLAQMQAERDKARMEAERAAYWALIQRGMALLREGSERSSDLDAKPAAAPSP